MLNKTDSSAYITGKSYDCFGGIYKKFSSKLQLLFSYFLCPLNDLWIIYCLGMLENTSDDHFDCFWFCCWQESSRSSAISMFRVLSAYPFGCILETGSFSSFLSYWIVSDIHMKLSMTDLQFLKKKKCPKIAQK